MNTHTRNQVNNFLTVCFYSAAAFVVIFSKYYLIRLENGDTLLDYKLGRTNIPSQAAEEQNTVVEGVQRLQDGRADMNSIALNQFRQLEQKNKEEEPTTTGSIGNNSSFGPNVDRSTDESSVEQRRLQTGEAPTAFPRYVIHESLETKFKRSLQLILTYAKN